MVICGDLQNTYGSVGKKNEINFPKTKKTVLATPIDTTTAIFTNTVPPQTYGVREYGSCGGVCGESCFSLIRVIRYYTDMATVEYNSESQ